MKKFHLVWFAAVLVGLPTSTTTAQEPVFDASRVSDIRERLEGFLEELHQGANFPGASLAIVLPDDQVVTASVGLADVTTNRAIAAEDRLMSASIGKTYFAAMALKLCQEGKLSLTDRVEKFLGDRAWFHRIPNATLLTVEHLMRHQSGLPRYVLERQVWKDVLSEPDMQWTPGDQLHYIYDRSPLHEPGAGWAYSDTNYILLGLILEEVSGSEAYQYVQQHFLDPNNLADTLPNNRRALPGLIQGYPKMFQSFGVPAEVIKDGKFVFNPAMEWCGGGFFCTPSDLAVWAKVLFSGRALQGDYVTMMTEHAADASAMLGRGSRYGLGVIIRPTKLGSLLGHDGGFPGYTSTMGYFPDQNFAAAFMFNSEGREALDQPAYQVIVEAVELANRR